METFDQNDANAAAAKAKSGNTHTPAPVSFKKGTRLTGRIHEEPTLLSFFFMFHFNDTTVEGLFGKAVGEGNIGLKTALNFFEKTVANSSPEYGMQKAAQLRSFTAILKKVNLEMPWFWQTVTGLEVARTITEDEPWKAAEKPKIEIECLEENIELTATKLMDLYRNIVFDTKRHVRILPANVSRFTLDIYVTEVRAFQDNTGSALLGSYRGSDAYDVYTHQTVDKRNLGVPYAKGFSKEDFSAVKIGETKPFFAIRLKGCEFDINSGQEVFAELSKNPEYKKPKIGIFYKSTETLFANGGPNLPLDALLKELGSEIAPGAPGAGERTPYDPMSDMPSARNMLSNMGNKVANAIGGALAKINNLAGGNKSKIGPNVHGATLTGPLANAVENFGGQIINNAIARSGNEKLKNLRKLFLGNVYGVGPGTSLRNAIGIASANAIGAIPILAAQIAQNNRSVNPNTGGLANVYDNTEAPQETVLPASNVYDNVELLQETALNGGNVYDIVSEAPTPSISPVNVYNGPAIDTTPDGNLNQNVYE